MKRFELLTPSSQTICATKLRYIPKIIIIYNMFVLECPV